MTYPACMNCGHSDEGWCLQCVMELDYKRLCLEADVVELRKTIEAYKKVCEQAAVPSLLIEFPEFVNPAPLTEREIQWAKEFVERRKAMNQDKASN